MIRSITLMIFLILLVCLKGNAQPAVDKKAAKEVKDMKDEGKEIKEGWTKGATINIAFNQASLTNWFAGGESFSTALNTMVKANAIHKKNKNLFKSDVDAAYGFLSTSSTKGMRKTDDRWVITSSLNREMKRKYWYYTLALQVKSQFTEGYTFEDGIKSPAQSAFMSPGDIKLGVGFTYQKTKDFSAYLSPATAKINLKLDHRFYDKKIYGVDSAKTYSVDLGAFIRLEYTKEINKELKYTGSLDAFYGYILKNYNFYSGNLINWKFNKYLGASFGLDLAFDNTQPSYKYVVENNVKVKKEGDPKLQVKQVFGIGFNYTF